MILQSNAQKVAENFYCLGPSRVPAYLLDGDTPLVFEGGIHAFRDIYLAETRKLLGDRDPALLCLTHMHFDHCGAAGHLKKHFPGLNICASAEGAAIIRKPSALQLITSLNEQFQVEPAPFVPFTVDRILADGEIIRASGNSTVEVIKTPGHTRDMLSYYIREIKTLVPSESAGVQLSNGYIYSEFLIDYDIYMKSLERLKGYAIENLMCAHAFYLTGDDARGYIGRAAEHAVRFRDRLESLIRIYGNDPDAIAAVVRKDEFDNISEDERQPEIAYLMNLKAKINSVARIMSL